MARSGFDREFGKHGPTRTNTAAHGRNGPCRSVQVCVGLCMLLFLAFAGVALGSMPSPTVPPSSYQSGLVNTPNPIDNSANLPITGNVLGGKHFRGAIPYESTNSFRAPLGSTSLDSFLRYSAVPEARTNYPQNYSPYYSPSGTVTTTVPGYQGVFSPSSPRIIGGMGQFRIDQPADAMATPEGPPLQVPRDELSAVVGPGLGASPRLRSWPMSPNAGEMKDIISDELGDRLNERPLSPTGDPLMTPQEYQERLEQLRRDVDRIQANASQLGQNPTLDSTTTPAQPPVQQPLQQLLPTAQPGQPVTEGLQTAPSTEGRFELYDPSADRETALPMPPGEVRQAREPSGSDATDPGKLPALQRIEETSRAFDATARFFDRSPNEQPGGAAGAPDRLRSPSATGRAAQGIAEPNPTNARPDAPLQSPGDDAPRTHENAGSLTQKQFDQYLTAAHLYLQQGRYYRAADSFTLASIYIPHDPRAHLGKSHALLAAGEYVSSAASLARAIELDARYALGEVDLVEIIGGPDAFVQRITNLEQGARGRDASQLQFLLAYVSLQMDQLSEARTAIGAARNGLPSSVAADLLETAIQQAAGK